MIWSGAKQLHNKNGLRYVISGIIRGIACVVGFGFVTPAGADLPAPAAPASELVSFLLFQESVQAEQDGNYETAHRLYKAHVNNPIEALRRNFSNDSRSLHLRSDASAENERADRLESEKQTLESPQILRLRYIALGLVTLLVLGALGMLVYQRRMMKILENNKRQAERASSAKSSFLANISHELRTPLNAILGFSEMAKNEILGPTGHLAYTQHAADIYDAGRHLLMLVDDILNISRAESGHLVLDEDLWDTNILVREAIDHVDYHDKNVKPQLSIDIASDIPQIYVDGRLVRQALVALLTNAVTYTPVDGHISLGCELNLDGTISFSVCDTGVGMTADGVREAMEPFGQISNEYQQAGEGIGLGLNLVKSYSERHGGSFEITSQKGVGTTARVTLPGTRVVHNRRAR